MRALESTSAALGQPVSSRMIGASARPLAAIGRWRHGPAVFDIPPSNVIRLAISLVDAPNTRTRDRSMPNEKRPGASVSMFAPMEGISVDVRGEADVIQLLVDQNAAQAALDRTFVCPLVIDLYDDGIRATIMRLFTHRARCDPDDGLMEDEDPQTLIAQIEAHANGWRRTREQPSELFRGGLAPSAFRRLDAMIENAIDEAGSPTLDDMARSIDLSVTHFIRSFRQHTGHTPHKYVVRRRLDRAVALLRRRANRVADVSDRVGFSTPAHIVATFRAVVGVTPGALRDALDS